MKPLFIKYFSYTVELRELSDNDKYIGMMPLEGRRNYFSGIWLVPQFLHKNQQNYTTTNKCTLQYTNQIKVVVIMEGPKWAMINVWDN